MIQFRTVLAADATSQVVQEPDGSLSHDALFPDKPWETTKLDDKAPETVAIRELLYSEKATLEEKALAIPVALALSKSETPDARDVTAMEDAKQAADVRKAEAQAEVLLAEGEVKP